MVAHLTTFCKKEESPSMVGHVQQDLKKDKIKNEPYLSMITHLISAQDKRKDASMVSHNTLSMAAHLTSADKSQTNPEIPKCARTADRKEATKPSLPNSDDSSNDVTEQSAGEKAGSRPDILNFKCKQLDYKICKRRDQHKAFHKHGHE